MEEREQHVLAESSEELEWILLKEPPHDVPVPIVLTAASRNASMEPMQSGSLVMVHWQIDGQAVVQELALPLRWPARIALDDQPLIIDLATTVALSQVETRVFRALDENGLPSPPASATWCRYLDPTAVCRITRETEQDTWRVTINLPGEAGTYYVSMRGAWEFPSQSPLIGTMDWLMFDAAWIFAVVTGQALVHLPVKNHAERYGCLQSKTGSGGTETV